MIKNPSQPKSKVKQIHVNNLKTYFDRDQPKQSNKPSPAQDSNSSTEDEVQPKSNSRKMVPDKAAKQSKQDLVVES